MTVNSNYKKTINYDNVILSNNKYILTKKGEKKDEGGKDIPVKVNPLPASESINKVWHIFYLLQLSAFWHASWAQCN